MIHSTRLLVTSCGFAFAINAAACSSTSTDADAGTDSGSSSSDSGLDAANVEDASSTTDAASSGDSGSGDSGAVLTATSCDGLTPIATVHMNSVGGFSPANISVSVGDTVKWVNDDSAMTHTVTSTAFSPTLNPGDTICLTFTFTGTFPYACTIHPSMTGSVEVH